MALRWLNAAELPLQGRTILQKLKELNGSITFVPLLFRMILIATAERISIIFHIEFTLKISGYLKFCS
jgi:hypothetical protein